MWLLAGLLALPLIEIALFVSVGGWIGLWPTLALVIATGVAGVLILRSLGLRTMDGFRQATLMRRDPLGQMADNALVATAALLLVLPGFLTDTIGLLLLLPPVRRLVIRGLAARAQVHGTGAFDYPRRGGPDVIDGEFFEIGQDQPEFPRDDRRLPEDGRH